MVKERLVWADAARGLLILLVVLGHTLQHGDYEHNVVWNVIYSFHMAAFFAISGYVSYRPEIRLNTIGRRAKQLLLPFFIWSFIQSLCLQKTGWQLFDFIVYPDMGFWFVYVLFFITMLMMLFNALAMSLNINSIYVIGGGNLLLISLMVLFGWRSFGFQFIAFYFFFYALGFFIKRFDIRFSFSWSIILGVCWLITAVFWHGHEVPKPLLGLTMIPSSILINGYRFLTATLGSLFVLGLSPFIFKSEERMLNRVLCYLGISSLGIYIIHMFVAHMIDYYNLLGCYFTSTTSISFETTFFIICAVLGIGVTYIVKKNKYISFF